MAERIEIYAEGIVCLSVCAEKDIPISEVEDYANKETPTGINHGWVKADRNFEDGSLNPCPCDNDNGRVHYLLNC